MLAEYRVIVEGTVGRGLGDLVQEASLGGAGAGQSVEVRVRQCDEGECIGWRKVCAQRRRCPANVVDNRGHEGSLFCSAPCAAAAWWTSPTLDFAEGFDAVYYIRVPARVPVGPIAQ